MLQGVFFYQLAIDVSAIGAVEILKEGIIEDINDQRVMSANRRIVYPYIVIRKAPNSVALLRHVVFGQNLIVQT
jgi:hypothetical protein